MKHACETWCVKNRTFLDRVKKGANVYRREYLIMPPVKMYTLSTCSHCRNAKQFLDECGIDYEYVDVDLMAGAERTTTIQEVKKYNPACSFPTICIGNKVIVGFNKEEIKAALSL